MSFKEKIVFDPESAAETDNIGAYVRSGKSGAQITHHAGFKPSAGSFTFIDGDVSVLNDTITEVAHGFLTGDKLQLTSSGVLPAGLALATDYWVIRVDADSIKLASSLVNAENGVAVDITAAAGGGTHTVTGFAQDIRALDMWLLNPSIEVTQGTSPWVIGDGGGSITVDANDLDIRNLSYLQDSVSIYGAGGNQLVVNADGSINVNADISVVNGHEKLEDAASANGDVGSYVLSVRSDSLASSTSNDGDFQSFKTDSVGALWVRMSQTPPADVDNQIDNAAIVVGTSAAAIATAVSGRRKMVIQNVDPSKPFYIGGASVTVANGIRLSPGAVMEIELDNAASLYAIAGQAGILGRLLETGYV